MSINFAGVQSMTIPQGKVVKITDSAGRVLWKKITINGTIYLRPSADISVEHNLNPVSSASAYLLINEEVADGSSTYISANPIQNTDSGSSTSKFGLAAAGQQPDKTFFVTSVNVVGESYSTRSANQNEFTLEINGVKTSTVSYADSKSSFDLLLPDAIGLINDAIASSGKLPDINMIITSYYRVGTDGGSNKTQTYKDGVTQAYVILSYEG